MLALVGGWGFEGRGELVRGELRRSCGCEAFEGGEFGWRLRWMMSCGRMNALENAAG